MSFRLNKTIRWFLVLAVMVSNLSFLFVTRSEAATHTEAASTMTPCVRFESQPLGATYNVGDNFIDAGVLVNALPFQWANGVWTNGGQIQVQNGGLAGGAGQEIHTNNINASFDFGAPITDLSFRFGEYGGNINIEVNGDFRNIDNFADIDGLNIGGTAVSVINGFGNDMGVVQLVGMINSFTVGGQELWIDDVCPRSDCIHFNDLPIGKIYGVGDSDVSNGYPFFAEPFQWANGLWTDLGFAEVEPAGLSGGSIHDMEVNNINLRFPLDDEFDKGLTMRFGEYGGNLNIEINGDFLNFDNFQDIHGAVIGGVGIRVQGGNGNDMGRMFLYGDVDEFMIGGQELHIDNICPIDCCIDFEGLPLGATYNVGDSFWDVMAWMTVRPFQWSDGTWTNGGFAQVQNGNWAGHVGQELNINNANVSFDFGGAVEGLSLHFGEYGGNLNIRINGDFRNFDNMADIDGLWIGGVFVEVINGFGNDQGILRLHGTVEDFMIGGQEFYIDHVCIEELLPNNWPCIHFNDLPLGANYFVGDTFVSVGTPIDARPFQWSNGVWTNGGVAEVDPAVASGGSGHEMEVNNINLQFNLGAGFSNGLTYQFGEYGGNLNLAINGDFQNFDNYQDVDGAIIGGTLVRAVNGFGNDMGRLFVFGAVNEIVIGGQELWIDNVCPLPDRNGFESLKLGDVYNSGDSFFDVTTEIAVGDLDARALMGQATVEDGGLAGHQGNELHLQDATLEFDFAPSADSVSLAFGEYGGDVYLEINGDSRSSADFADVDGDTVGGVDVTVINGMGNDSGIMLLTGSIDTLIIGGQDVYLDDVQVEQTTAPTAVTVNTMQASMMATPIQLLLIAGLLLSTFSVVTLKRKKST